MPSERVQRQIDRLLDEAEQASAVRDWLTVAERCRHALTFDPDSEDASALLAAAERGLAASPLPLGEGQGEGQPQAGANPVAGSAGILPAPVVPVSFAGGRYQVKRFLGEGGKKRVYLAHDNLLDRDVAFALIKTEGLDAVARERVAREAQAMGRLGSHPRIVTVFDLGEEPLAHTQSPGLPSPSPRGGGDRGEVPTRPYMVTELMGGGDVEGLIEKAPEHRLPMQQALRIATQVCEGLEFAHGKGIVHRDLKPGNVWLTASALPSPSIGRGAGGEGPDAKIGDFGLAVAIDRTRLTQAGMMVGTVGYMPPEQATGGEVTERSDLYSLGAMLYELVTGRPPFIGDEAVAIIGQHLNTPPVAPSWHRPDCPPELETLILRLLEKDPSKRPASAAEVRQALESVVQAAGHPSSSALLPQGEKGGPPSPLEGEGLRVRGEAGGGVDAQAQQNPLYRRAFVGRETELRALHSAFDAALSGRGSLAMVVGEPGIGKTSVCEQLATYATLRGGKTLVGHCYEEGSLSLPYLPFVEAMRSYVLAREPDGLKSDLGSGAEDLARIVSEIRDRVPDSVGARHASPDAPGDPEEQRWRILQAVTGFLRNASAVQPLVIILEDLHDADRGTLDLLVHLSRNLDGARLLLAGTYRDVEVDRGHPLSNALAELQRGQNFLRVPLRGLTAEEVQRMMAAVAQREIPWPFAELVHRQTEGNPLFVQEMLRYLVEEGLVAEQGGALRRVGDDTLAGRIPEGLRDVIGKRLSRLADKTNQVLSIASVVGREFRLDVLQQVANLPQEDVEAALEEAGSVAVVEQRQAIGGQLSFRFTHAFFRQTLYEELFAARRIRLHQQVARALEAVYGRRVDEHAAELAEHYSNSSDPGDLGKAVEYGEIAAKRAMAVFAYGEAASHLEQALKAQDVLDPDDKLKRCDLLLALGEALLPSEEPERVVALSAEGAFTLAETLGDNECAARAAIMAIEALWRSSQYNLWSGTPQSRVWCERADQFAPEGTALRVIADAYVGANAIQTVGRERGHEYLRRAAAMARQVDDNGAFYTAAGFALQRLLALRDHATLYDLAKEALQRDRRGVRSGDLANCLLASAPVLLEHGDRAAAEQVWLDLKELAARTRDVTVSIWATQPELYEAFLGGRLEETVALIEAMRAKAEAAGLRAVTVGSAQYSRALLYLGQTDAALQTVSQTSNRVMLAFRADCLAHLGRREEALALRAGFEGIELDEDESGVSVLSNLFETAVLTGDRETAAALSRRLAPLAASPWAQGVATSYGRLLAGAAALMGEAEQARTYYLQALEACEQIRFRPEIALIHLELAELQLAHYPAERTAAIDHLDFAIAEFREMKMQPSLERALRHKEVLKA